MREDGFFDRRLGRALVRLFLAILLGAGVASPAWAQCDPDPGDDEPSTAVDLVNSCGTDHACLNSSADVDNYSFDLQHRTQIVIETRGDTDTMMKLYQLNGSSVYIIESDNDSGEGNNAWITEILEAGRYYIEVMGYDGATGQYDLVRSGCCGGDDYNDWFTWADDLLSGWTANAQIDCEGDQDFYKIHADAGTGRYEVTLTSNGNWVMCRYDSSGTQLGACSNDSPQVLDLTDGWYGYVEVKAFDDVSTFSYTITVGTPCGDDPGNDTPSEATDLGSACTTRTADIDCDDDVDYYRFTAPRTGTFTFSVASNDAISITVTDSYGNSLGQSSTSVQASLVSGNVVYVEVEAGIPGQTPSYDLTISGCSCGYDPGNDTHGTATELNGRCGTTHEGIDCESDVDWFRFTAPDDATYTFETTGSTDTVMELYDDQIQIITSDDDSGDGSNARITHQLSMGSTYFVKVRGYSSSTTGQYDLVVSGCPCGGDPGDSDQAHATDLGSSCGTHSAAIDCTGDDDWYRFIVPNDGTFVFRTLGTGSYHTLLSLYVGGIRVEIDTDSVSHALSSGDTVYLLVQSDTGDTFDYQLEISGCSSGGCGGDPGDDDADHATDIGSSCGSRGGSIDCAGDHDYFRFTAPSDGTFTFSASGGATTTIDLEDDQGNPIDSADGSLSHDLAQGQIVAIGLSASDGTSTYDYTFTVSGCSPGGCGADPGDDDMAHATDLGGCGTVSAALDCDTDEDWYRFAPAAAGDYQIVLGVSFQAGFELYDGSGALLGQSSAELTAYLDPADGPFAIAVLSGLGLTGAYDLTVSGCAVASCGGEIPNDDPATATDLPGTGTWSDAFDCPGDIDFFRFIPATDGTYIFETGGGMDTELWLRDASAALIVFDDDGGTGLNAMVSAALTAGQAYFVQLAEHDGRTGPYDLIITGVSDCVGDADGGTPAGATPLPGTGTYGAAFDCPGDVDYFTFVPDRTALHTVGTAGAMDTTIELSGPGGATVAIADDGGSGMNARVQAVLDSGRAYTIRVAEATGATGPYELVVSAESGSSGDETFRYLVPASARLAGVADTNWSSDLVLSNPGDEPIHATVAALVRDRANPSPTTVRYDLAPGETLRIADVLGAFEIESGAAALLISADHPLVVVSRTFNSVASGTYGQFIPGVLVEQATVPGTKAYLAGLMEYGEHTGYRSNLGLVNLEDHPVSVTVQLHDADGNPLGTARRYTLEAREYIQRTRVLREVTNADVPMAWAELSAGGRFIAYVSVVDNASGDPVYRMARPLSSKEGEVVLMGLAKVAGAAGTNWVSDAVFLNPGGTTVSLEGDLWERDAGAGPTSTTSLFLDPGRCYTAADLLESLFGLDRGAASLVLRFDRGILAAARTYNLVATGTFGQNIPGYGSWNVLTPGDVGYLAMVEQDESFRTNLGLMNGLQDAVSEVVLILRDRSGQQIGTAVGITLEPGRVLQMNRVVERFTTSEFSGGRLELRVTAGAVLAYGSVVDQLTGDPVFETPTILGDRP